MVEENLAPLDQLKKDILEARFGLMGERPLSQKDTALSLRITIYRVRKEEREALQTLRQLQDPLKSALLDALTPNPRDPDFPALCKWVGIPVKVGKTARGRARIRDQVILTASDTFRD